MKYLLLFLAFAGCGQKEAQQETAGPAPVEPVAVIETEEPEDTRPRDEYGRVDISKSEIDAVGIEVKKGNYSVLLPYFSKKELGAFVWLLNGQGVVKDYGTTVEGEQKFPWVTKPYQFKQAGKLVAQTNEYNVIFLNDQEVLWDLDDIKALPNAECFGFYSLMEKAFAAEEPQDIIKLYEAFHLVIMREGRGLIAWSDIDNRIPKDPSYSKVFDTYLSVVYPTKERQRTMLLNLPLYYISPGGPPDRDISKNLIITPNQLGVWPFLSSTNEEYECLPKE